MTDASAVITQGICWMWQGLGCYLIWKKTMDCRNHRNADVREKRDLNGLLYRADKASRACYVCAVARECSWSNRKKNQDLIW